MRLIEMARGRGCGVESLKSKCLDLRFEPTIDLIVDLTRGSNALFLELILTSPSSMSTPRPCMYSKTAPDPTTTEGARTLMCCTAILAATSSGQQRGTQEAYPSRERDLMTEKRVEISWNAFLTIGSTREQSCASRATEHTASVAPYSAGVDAYS